MVKKRTRGAAGGSARMKEFGYRKVEVWLDSAEFARIEEAARRAGRKLATWIRKVAFDQAVAELGTRGPLIARAALERDLVDLNLPPEGEELP